MLSYLIEIILMISWCGIIFWAPLFVFMLLKAISLAVRGQTYKREAVWASVALLAMNPAWIKLLTEI